MSRFTSRASDDARWAVRMVIIRFCLDRDERMFTESTPRATPDMSDLMDVALERLDRLYAGAITPADMIVECDQDQSRIESG